MRRRHRACVLLAATAVLLTAPGPGFGAVKHPARVPASGTVRSCWPTKREIAALFDEWNAALATGDPHRVAALYARDAVLLPTLSPMIRTTHAGIVDYFAHFLLLKPSARIQWRSIEILGPNAALDTGRYQITTITANGRPSRLNARFTFVYVRRAGRWLIINHHSSVVPDSH